MKEIKKEAENYMQKVLIVTLLISGNIDSK